jgi:hypothetical protein
VAHRVVQCRPGSRAHLSARPHSASARRRRASASRAACGAAAGWPPVTTQPGVRLGRHRRVAAGKPPSTHHPFVSLLCTLTPSINRAFMPVSMSPSAAAASSSEAVQRGPESWQLLPHPMLLRHRPAARPLRPLPRAAAPPRTQLEAESTHATPGGRGESTRRRGATLLPVQRDRHSHSEAPLRARQRSHGVLRVGVSGARLLQAAASPKETGSCCLGTPGRFAPCRAAEPRARPWQRQLTRLHDCPRFRLRVSQMSAVRGSSFATGSARLTVAAPARAARRAAPPPRAMADGAEGAKKETMWAEARALQVGNPSQHTGATRSHVATRRHAPARCFSGAANGAPSAGPRGCAAAAPGQRQQPMPWPMP